ncbi:MAG: hypothetical protein HQM03_18005 [Magnetococcales bacterium]|nr:hypothetical protein [Magnetococcales bacterium]
METQLPYILGRQNPIGQPFSEIDVNSALEAISANFKEAWLKKDEHHPLQILWKRKDALSTIELFTLGRAILLLSEIDPRWVKYQVDLSRGNDANNRRGALFELLSACFLSTNSQKVVPARINQKGFDVTVRLHTGNTFNLSIKNHGYSYHHEEFRRRSRTFEIKLREGMKPRKFYWLQVFIEFNNGYPNPGDWANLERYFPSFLDEYKGDVAHSRCGEWSISLSDRKSPGDLFHTRYNSYTFVVTSSFHKNENQNLISKLDQASNNLEKHGPHETQDSINMVYFRVPQDVSLENCISWGKQYFCEKHNSPISGVLFYQPSVVYSDGKHFIAHYSLPVISDNFIKWKARSGAIPAMSFPVGVVCNQLPANHLTDGKALLSIIKEKYLYQSGKHFMEVSPDCSGGFSGNLSRPGPGIHQYSVFTIDDNDVILQGRFGDELLIL